MPPSVSPSAARWWKRRADRNRTPATVATKAPDPIMIGNAARRSMPSRLNTHEARRVVADPQRQKCAERKVDRQREREGRRRQGARRTAGRSQTEQAEGHEHDRHDQRRADAELNRAPRKPGHDSGSQPPARHAHGNERRQLQRIHLDHADEQHGLRQDRQRVADDDGARNQLIGHEAEQAKCRGRRRERTDAERVEEVGDEPDDEIERRRPLSCAAPRSEEIRRASRTQRTRKNAPPAASAPSRVPTRVMRWERSCRTVGERGYSTPREGACHGRA